MTNEGGLHAHGVALEAMAGALRTGPDELRAQRVGIRAVLAVAVTAAFAAGCGSGAASGGGSQAAGGLTAGPASGGVDGGGATAPDDVAPVTPPEVAWEWQGEDPSFGHTFYQGPITVRAGGESCSFTYDDEEHTARTACEAEGAEPWNLEETDAFVEDASLALDGGVLYVTRFSDIATGCQVTAYDAASGTVRWGTRLQGIGPIGHSEYLNKVEMKVLDARWLAVFGWESGGCYVEVLDRGDGRTVSNRRLEPVEAVAEEAARVPGASGTCPAIDATDRWHLAVVGADRVCEADADCVSFHVNCSNLDCAAVHKDRGDAYQALDCDGYTGGVGNYDCLPQFGSEEPRCVEGCCASVRLPGR
ncbi:MAG: hypothetical protein HY905_16240 [Deltaproteobacteria bacterium]|nr:hypothetical protein [Deltaproteobacteria bacterium]